MFVCVINRTENEPVFFKVHIQNQKKPDSFFIGIIYKVYKQGTSTEHEKAIVWISAAIVSHPRVE